MKCLTSVILTTLDFLLMFRLTFSVFLLLSSAVFDFLDWVIVNELLAVTDLIVS